MDLSLDNRSGLPPELRVLYEQYPRELWLGHADIEGTGRFWLDRHNAFREIGAALEQGLADFREERVEAARFGRWLVPLLSHFLNDLNGHHQVEDGHYFPVFRAADARLTKGFDILDRDHEAIHGLIDGTVGTANALLGTLEGDPDRLRRAADAYADTSLRLVRGLMRHLEDEEDIIIPMILERGEAGF